MRRFTLLCLLILVLVIVGHFAKKRFDYIERHHEIVRCLQRDEMEKAHALLEQKHEWNRIIAELSAIQDPTLFQRALDLQFVGYESRDKGDSDYPQRLDIIRRLVAQGAKPTYANLLIATRQDKTTTALFFLQQGVPANGSEEEDSVLAAAIEKPNIKLVHAFLKAGADVNHVPNTNYSIDMFPLAAAASHGRTDITKLLLAQGADPMRLDRRKYAAWELIRDSAYEYIAARESWHLVKPIVEKRLGHKVAEYVAY